MKLRPGLFIALVSVFLLTFTSCVKDYICECEISYSGKPNLPDTVINRYEITDSKKNAETLCRDNSGEYENDGIKTIEDCELY